MRVPVSTFVGTSLALGIGCTVTEAFLLPPVLPAGSGAQTAAGIASPQVARAAASVTATVVRTEVGATAYSCNRRGPPSGAGRGQARRATIAAVRPSSSPLPEGEVGEKGQQRRAKPRASSTRGGRGKLISRHLSPTSAAAAAATAVAQQLRQTAATTLAAAVLIVASTSTEQDIMTAMMGIDPSLAPAKSGGTQTALTLPAEGNSGAPSAAAAGGPGEPPLLGSIDLTGQSSGAGEISGGPGGGFRNGRLMIDESSDLAMMLGKKMKAPTVDPLTH